MNQGSVGVVKTRHFTFADHPDDFLTLDSGKKIGPVTVAYETYGKLLPDQSNAVLICHALSGDAHAAGFHGEDGKKPGWWENAVGPGKAFDSDKYFIICSNIIGGCSGTTGPSSIDPKTDKPYGLRFPVVTIGDMVEVQKRLLDHLGIKKLLAAAGGSMGGMQVLEWALRYPELLESGLVIASTSRLSAQGIAFNAVGRNAIVTDPNWNDGDYYSKNSPARGLSTARMIAHITYLSDESMHKKFGRRLQKRREYGYDFESEFEIESYLDHQGNKFVERFDANSYLYITKAMDYFDIAQAYGEGSLEKALSTVKSRLLLLSFTSDWLFPPYQSKEIVDNLLRHRKDVSYINIVSSYGHDAFLLEVETEEKLISAFLAATYTKMKEREAVKL